MKKKYVLLILIHELSYAGKPFLQDLDKIKGLYVFSESGK